MRTNFLCYVCKGLCKGFKYTLKCGGVDVDLTFTSPLLMDDLNLLAWPVSYVSIKTAPNDDRENEVQVYFGASSVIAENEREQEMTAENGSSSRLSFVKTGTKEQPVLEKKGDDLRMDWGYFYIAPPKEANVKQNISSLTQAPSEFMNNSLSASKNEGKNLMLNTVFPKERLSSEKEYLLLLGYDDIYSINYFDTQLRPWWNGDGKNSIQQEFEQAYTSYDNVIKKCKAFHQKLYQDGVETGGEEYAKLLKIAYRQDIAAHKLPQSPQGDILFLSKENFSNGSINTVDITYPSASMYLIYNPDPMNGIFY